MKRGAPGYTRGRFRLSWVHASDSRTCGLSRPALMGWIVEARRRMLARGHRCRIEPA